MRSVTHVCYRMDLILDLVSAIDVLQCDAQPPADLESDYRKLNISIITLNVLAKIMCVFVHD